MNLRQAAENVLASYFLSDPAQMPAAMSALRASLAEPDEPVAWAYVNSDGECEEIEYGRYDEEDDSCITHLYTHPPRREPLTEEEVRRLYREAWTPESEADEVLAFARTIERVHGIGTDE